MNRCTVLRSALRALLLLFLFAGAAAAPRAASAQIDVTNIATAYGAKYGWPATLTNTNVSINGYNFPTNSRLTTFTLMQKISDTQWVALRNLTPSYRSSTRITVNIGTCTPGDYCIWVTETLTNRDSGLLRVVPNTVALEQAAPNFPKPGNVVTLYGNMLPTVGTKVVLTPPAEMSPWMTVREITPTTFDRFTATFTVPADVWGGTWQVHYKGLINAITEISTNKLPLYIEDKVKPKYSVQLYSFKCIKETNDWGLSDETYCSMIAFDPTRYGLFDWYSFGTYGSNMCLDVDSGEFRYPMTSMDKLNEGDWREIEDPSKAYYIVGLGETDNYWVNGGQWDLSLGESPDSWGRFKAKNTVIAWNDHGSATDPASAANGIKNMLASQIATFGGDECIGTKVVTWSKSEVYTVRATGQSVSKSFHFYGDYSDYLVTVRLMPNNLVQ